MGQRTPSGPRPPFTESCPAERVFGHTVDPRFGSGKPTALPASQGSEVGSCCKRSLLFVAVLGRRLPRKQQSDRTSRCLPTHGNSPAMNFLHDLKRRHGSDRKRMPPLRQFRSPGSRFSPKRTPALASLTSGLASERFSKRFCMGEACLASCPPALERA